jgi:exosortase
MYLQFALLALLLSSLYYSVVLGLVRQWTQDPSYSYGFFVPLFSVLWCWMHRDLWTGRRICPSNSGLIAIVSALALLVVGTLGAEVFLQRISLILLLGGLIAYFAGWGLLRSFLAPWLFLFLMVPLPAIVFNEVAFPLQLLASRLSTSCLEVFHIPVLREGNVIILPSITLDVAEACSGIRSLMSLITLAIFYGSLAERRNWMRWILAVVAVPMAVAANALRIVGAALFGYYWGPRFAEGFFHSFSGWLMFVLALVLLVLLHKFSSRLLPWRAPL